MTLLENLMPTFYLIGFLVACFIWGFGGVLLKRILCCWVNDFFHLPRPMPKISEKELQHLKYGEEARKEKAAHMVYIRPRKVRP